MSCAKTSEPKFFEIRNQFNITYIINANIGKEGIKLNNLNKIRGNINSGLDKIGKANSYNNGENTITYYISVKKRFLFTALIML